MSTHYEVCKRYPKFNTTKCTGRASNRLDSKVAEVFYSMAKGARNTWYKNLRLSQKQSMVSFPWFHYHAQAIENYGNECPLRPILRMCFSHKKNSLKFLSILFLMYLCAHVYIEPNVLLTIYSCSGFTTIPLLAAESQVEHIECHLLDIKLKNCTLLLCGL